MADFCCDQVVVHDNARNRFLWYRQGLFDANSVNRFRIGVSGNGGKTFCNYDVSATNVDGNWTNQGFDYPHLEVGADYLYITLNMYGPNWLRTIVLRWPLDALRNCSGFSYNYFTTNAWFTLAPTQGADHVMYFGSNWPSSGSFNRFAIWKWEEDGALTSYVRNIPAYTVGFRGDYVCGNANGNWAARTDIRMGSGARYEIMNTNLKNPGRRVVGWWWNAPQGGGFAQPYINAAAFYEDTLTAVGGAQGRPYIWNSDVCFLYANAAANQRGDLALVVNYSSGAAKNPSVGFMIADDYTTAPPGFTFFTARTGSARPSDNVWGDYNAVRPNYPAERVWTGSSHYIAGGANCSRCATPVFFVFGRERDYGSWNRWQNK